MIIVEYISDGYKHSEVNAATIAIFIKKYPKEKIYLFCGKGYFNILKNILKKHNINCNNIEHHSIKPFTKQVRDYKMIFFDFNIVQEIFGFAKKYSETNILFLYTSTFMLYYIKLFCIFNKGISINTIIHGDLERIDLISYAKSFKKGRLWQFLYALFFGLRIPLAIPTPDNLKFIVLGENIRENTEKLLPNLKKRVEVIPLPYFYYHVKERIPFIDNKVHLCVPGLSSARKNIPTLRKLIKTIDNNSSLKNKVELAFSGLIMDKLFYEEMLEKDYVNKLTVSMSMLSPEVRNNSLLNADYALMTYQLCSYKLIASGAFSDVINAEIPVIAIRNSYIEQYFKKYGNVGYMFDSYEELENKVKNIIQEFPYQEYEIQVNNIRLIKKTESIENIFIDMDRSRND